MTALQLEALTLRAVDQVRAGQPVEDGQIELKRALPKDPYKAARRIGGHANASQGQPIVWIIGLDETEGVKGADKAELSDWWPQVQRYFDDLAPEFALQPMNVPVKGSDGEALTVVAFAFDTSRLPFVVTNGSGKGGPIQREVPYRDATGLRSAKRGDLIRMTSPATPRVEVDLMSARLYLAEGNGTMPDAAKGPPRWQGAVDLYVNPIGEGQAVFPAHLCSAEVISAGSPPMPLAVRFLDRKEVNTVISVGDLIVTGPGKAQASVRSTQSEAWGINNHLQFRLKLQPLRGDAPLIIACELTPSDLSSLELRGRPWSRVRGWEA